MATSRSVGDTRWVYTTVFAAMFSTGLACLLYEVVLISIVSVLLGVTEKSTSLVIAAFLLGLALGALIGGHLTKRRIPLVPAFVTIELLVAAFGFSAIPLLTWISNLMLTRLAEFWIILLILLIPTTLMGMEIPIAVRILNRTSASSGRDAGFVYFADTLGGVIGALFAGVFIIPKLGFPGALYLGGILNCTTALLASRINRRGWGMPLLSIAFLIAGIGWLGTTPQALHAAHLNFYQSLSSSETLYTEVTPFQRIQIIASPFFGNMLHLDNQLQISEGDSLLYHEFLTLPALAVHRNPERVLVIGGGDGGVLYQLLQRNLSITQVELDERVIAVARQYLPGVHHGALDDPRVERHIGDGRKFLRDTETPYDVIIIDLPDPDHIQLALLYSAEFYELVRRALRPGGVMAQQAVSLLSNLEASTSIYNTAKTVFPNVRMYNAHTPAFGTISFLIASADPDANLTVPQRSISGKWYASDAHAEIFAMPKFLDEYLAHNTIPITTDANPAVFLFTDTAYYAQGVRDAR